MGWQGWKRQGLLEGLYMVGGVVSPIQTFIVSDPKQMFEAEDIQMTSPSTSPNNQWEKRIFSVLFFHWLEFCIMAVYSFLTGLVKK